VLCKATFSSLPHQAEAESKPTRIKNHAVLPEPVPVQAKAEAMSLTSCRNTSCYRDHIRPEKQKGGDALLSFVGYFELLGRFLVEACMVVIIIRRYEDVPVLQESKSNGLKEVAFLE
jgi:hypothetical protein